MDLGRDAKELTCLSNVLWLPMPWTPKVIAKVRTKGGRQYDVKNHANELTTRRPLEEEGRVKAMQ